MAKMEKHAIYCFYDDVKIHFSETARPFHRKNDNILAPSIAIYPHLARWVVNHWGANQRNPYPSLSSLFLSDAVDSVVGVLRVLTVLSGSFGISDWIFGGLAREHAVNMRVHNRYSLCHKRCICRLERDNGHN